MAPLDKEEIAARYRVTLDRRREGLQQVFDQIIPPGARIVWEVGSGHGHFLNAYAAAHPEKLCIGVDLVSERVERAMRKRDRAGLENLYFIKAEARLFLETLPPGVEVSEIFILFPDPWPKARHHKHRILQPPFLAAAAARATPGCRLHFRTDHAPYFSDTAAMVAAHADWVVVQEPWPFESETVFQSRAPAYQSLIAARRMPVISASVQ